MPPAGWRSQAELDRAERVLRARYNSRLEAVVDRRVIGREVREREDRVDRERAGAARVEARAQRELANQVGADTDGLIRDATVALFAARDAAKVVEGGPGIFGRRAARVDAAREVLVNTAASWGEEWLPGPSWSDDQVRQAGMGVAGAVIAARVGYHQAEADRWDRVAVDAQWRVGARERGVREALETNRRNGEYREAASVELEAGLARVGQARQVRAAQIKTLSAAQIDSFDQAREHWLAGHYHGRYRDRGPETLTRDPGMPGTDGHDHDHDHDLGLDLGIGI